MFKNKLLNPVLFLMFFPFCSFGLTPATSPEPAQSSGSAEESSGSASYSPVAREYHLKAAFLRYVAKFVEWPANLQSSPTINLCVLGLLPSFEAINSINGKDVNEHTLNITKIASISDANAKKCHMVFISKTEEENLKNIVDTIGTQPILDFGDMDHFAEKGGDMNFYILNNRLAIMINPPAVEKSNLKISDRMLKVVTVVPPIDQSAKTE